jgi:hypothetical protein
LRPLSEADPPPIELIWSYWHAEGILALTMNTPTSKAVGATGLLTRRAPIDGDLIVWTVGDALSVRAASKDVK